MNARFEQGDSAITAVGGRREGTKGRRWGCGWITPLLMGGQAGRQAKMGSELE